MRRSLPASLVAGAGVAWAAAFVPVPAGASNPATATVSFDHPSQVFVQSQPMNGGAPAGFVQTICTSQPGACDAVTFTVDPSIAGAIDH